MAGGLESNLEAAAVLKCNCFYLAFCTEKDLLLIISGTIILYLFKLNDSSSHLNVYRLGKNKDLKEQWRLCSTLLADFADTKYCRYFTQKLSLRNTQILCAKGRETGCAMRLFLLAQNTAFYCSLAQRTCCSCI